MFRDLLGYAMIIGGVFILAGDKIKQLVVSRLGDSQEMEKTQVTKEYLDKYKDLL